MSYADKFSRHVIVIIPKVAFKDNSHVGAFVGEVCFSWYFTFIAWKYGLFSSSCFSSYAHG